MIPVEKCSGCRNSFYNGRANCDGANRCWNAKTGKMVDRYRIYYLTAPTEKGAFAKVRVPSCYHQANGYHFQDRLPSFVKPSDVNRANSVAGEEEPE